ncbi:glutathione s-transferase [Basidiobolus ranarum]|uniref:Glutathione s-transferase n=1 Tax=Basidiobolus ranarum TaxID=34480 RepID=A0ABR2VV03_9FUNG
MSQPTKLYYNTKSVYSSIIRLYFHEKGVTVDETVHLDLGKGEQNTPEYHKVNPFTKVPVFVHGPIVVPDSRDITRYAEKAFANLNDLAPTHPEKANRILNELHTLRMAILTYGVANEQEAETKKELLNQFKARRSALKQAIDNYPDIAEDLKKKLQGTDKLLETMQNFEQVQEEWGRTEELFKWIDTHLENRTYLDGTKYTYTDSHFTSILSRISHCGHRRSILQYPNLARYWKEVQGRESYKMVFDIPCNISDHPEECTCR